MTRPIRAAGEAALPYLEIAVGAVWWIVGSLALAGGPGTVVLAAGIGATGLLWTAVRRRQGAGAALGPGLRAKVIRLAAVAVGLVVVSGALLGAVGWDELAVPVACVLIGALLFPLSSVLEERSWVAAGAVLMVLGAGGALLALDTAGQAVPQGLVGMGAAVVLWAAGVYRLGLFQELRDRVGR
ncbi:hypothetical protein ACVGVM_07120 [Pseudonocardia bannensis]|uniref:Uncharacterized protein n=1 Tax=Pseudonocardia bannensis TaxID=630973 RepID=A0A848DKU7_9PSEU|nr:hypothetical protein [Pseudonocardia bannensis]NMH93173.1 hypothetical protein [Pseudonocardia bannensis]